MIVGEPKEGDKGYFDKYQKIEHYPYCPDESVDMFSLPEAKKYEDLIAEMQGEDGDGIEDLLTNASDDVIEDI